MKLAVLSESSADEEVIRILIEGILGKRTQVVASPPLRTRGWPSVRQVLPGVLKHLHYRTEAEAFVLVVDSNRSPPHQSRHDLPDAANPECRLCQLRQIVDRVQREITPVPNRPAIKTAIGVAVPSMEAWYVCGRDEKVSEAAWVQGLERRAWPYTNNSLKQAVYRIDRPSLEQETNRAVEEAHRLVQNLDHLEKLFPNGFGALAGDVRSW